MEDDRPAVPSLPRSLSSPLHSPVRVILPCTGPGRQRRRDGTLSSLVGAIVRRDRYFVEQASFFLSFLPALVLGRPDVVYFADLNLGLPAGQPVVLAVGMLDGTVKRTGDLIRELAALPAPRPFLALLGADDPDAGAVLRENYVQLLPRVAEAA